MNLTLIDYSGLVTNYDIGDKERITHISISVVSGDEIAYVTFENGSIEIYDTGINDRFYDFYDYDYVLYDKVELIDLTESERWLTRESSYDVCF